MAKGQVEREFKLEAGVGFRVPDLDAVCEGVTAVALAELRLVARYVDTPDLRLVRAGLTLRHREERSPSAPTVSEWTLKLPAGDGSSSGEMARRELVWPGSPNTVPAEADLLVRAARRTGRLGPVARLVTQRRRLQLKGPMGEPLLEVDDDLVSVMEGPRLAARFREVEVELFPDCPPDVAATVVERLEAAGAQRGDQRPKVVRALGAKAAEPPDVVRVPLGKRATVAECARAAIAEGFLRLVEHHPGVQLDEDPEDVHQARVATRRMRSDLKTFAGVLDSKWVDHTRTELSWLAAGLGAVRDTDVLLERLRGRFPRLSASDAVVAQRLVRRLVGERDVALRSLMEMLGSQRYIELLEILASAVLTLPLAEAVEEVPAEPDETGHAAGDAAGGHLQEGDLVSESSARIVEGPWRHLRRAVDALGDSPVDEALHEVRIRAKRLRYACEALAGSAGRPARDLASAAAALQEVLGSMHDAVVAEEWLRAAAVDASAEDALVAGQLIAVEREIAEAGRAGWKEAWDRIDRKRMRAWLR